MKDEQIGSRKVILTKWTLIIQGVAAVAYLVAQAYSGAPISDNFIPSVIFGPTGVLAAFTGGNVMEHRSGISKVMDGLKGKDDTPKK